MATTTATQQAPEEMARRKLVFVRNSGILIGEIRRACTEAEKRCNVILTKKWNDHTLGSECLRAIEVEIDRLAEEIREVARTSPMFD